MTANAAGTQNEIVYDSKGAAFRTDAIDCRLIQTEISWGDIGILAIFLIRPKASVRAPVNGFEPFASIRHEQWEGVKHQMLPHQVDKSRRW